MSVVLNNKTKELEVTECKLYCSKPWSLEKCSEWCRNVFNWTEENYKALVKSTLEYLY